MVGRKGRNTSKSKAMTATEIKATVREAVRDALIEFMSPNVSQVQAAEMLKVHPRTIARMIQDGRLTATNGKISKEELIRQLIK